MLYVTIPESYSRVEKQDDNYFMVSDEEGFEPIDLGPIVAEYLTSRIQDDRITISRSCPRAVGVRAGMLLHSDSAILGIYRECVVGRDEHRAQIAMGASSLTFLSKNRDHLSESSVEKIEKKRKEIRDMRRGPERRY